MSKCYEHGCVPDEKHKDVLVDKHPNGRPSHTVEIEDGVKIGTEIWYDDEGRVTKSIYHY
jgi:hypothetical protein